MGVLDNVFGGDGGIVSILSETLGGDALLKTITGRTRNEETLTFEPFYSTKRVAFVPESVAQDPGTATADGSLEQAKTKIVGSVPAAGIENAPRADSGDLLLVDGVEYKITDVEALRVGNVVVQYKLTGVVV